MKQLSTNVSDEVFKRWQEFCKEQNKNSYQMLREVIEEVVLVPVVPPIETPVDHQVVPVKTESQSGSGTTLSLDQMKALLEKERISKGKV